MGLQRLSGPDVCNRCLFRFDEQASLTILVDEIISLDLVVEDICVFDWRPNLFSSLMPSDRAYVVPPSLAWVIMIICFLSH